ncbi:MAG: flavodoxin [Candidatus Diapherotrites archaeon]|nr:flavodoxin [Candidatus Diapherotrites archaeon]
MNVKVIYSTLTGNTKKVADAIAEEIGTTAEDVKNVVSIGDVDLLAVGTGCYNKSASKEIVKFLNSLDDLVGLKVILFGTYGFDDDALREMADILNAKSANIVGRWGCKGSLLYLLHNRGLPSEGDLMEARKFIRKLKETKKI